MVEQTLADWVKLHRAGKLKGVIGKSAVTAEQMEISKRPKSPSGVRAVARASMRSWLEQRKRALNDRFAGGGRCLRSGG